MAWVRQAIDGTKADPYEELYPTAYGSSAEKPDIFWALNPNDVPPPVKRAVEAAVRQQTVEHSLRCAIIRLETLGGYYTAPETSNKGAEPVGHFAIYLGTSPADTELKTHLPTDTGNPPRSAPPDPPPAGSARGKINADAGTEQQQEEEEGGGARTPSMGGIEEEYGRVEEQSKKRSSKRLSKVTASVGSWMRLN